MGVTSPDPRPPITTASGLVARLPWRLRVAHRIAGFFIAHPARGTARLRRLVARSLAPRPSGPVVVSTALGFPLLIDPRIGFGVEHAIYYEGIYEAGTLYFLQHALQMGDVFVDAGANIGLMSIAAARWVGARGRVYAFEPLQATFELLLRNIELNHALNVTAHAVALGSSPEFRSIYERRQAGRGATTLVAARDGQASDVVEVDTLDRFLERSGRPTVRLVKIDVEGWELELLAGARELLAGADAPMLVLEYSTAVRLAGGAHRDLLAFLDSVNDYKFFRLVHGKESVSRLRAIRGPDDLPSEDNIFCLRPGHMTPRMAALIE